MEKTERKTDRRVIKTKRAVKNALMYLLNDRDINDITIIELAETADINRKTFYNYYSGVYQVVEDIENDILASYMELLGGVEFKEYMEAPFALFERFSQLINMDPDREKLYETCQRLGVGITVMKAFAGGDILDENLSPAVRSL